MVGVDVDGVDQVLDEYSPFPVVCFVPDGGDVDRGEQLGDLFESLGQLGAHGSFLGVFGVGGFEFTQLCGQALFFVSERFGADPVGVVEVEQLGPFSFERSDSWPTAGGCRVEVGVSAQLGADGRLQFGVLAEEVEPEQRCTVQPLGGSSRHIAALATVLAAVDGVASVVVLDACDTFAESAANPTREQVPAPALAGCVGTLGGVELRFCHECFVQCRVPVVVMSDEAAVDPVQKDLTHGGVLDAGAFFDGPVGEPVGSEGEDSADDVGVVAGH